MRTMTYYNYSADHGLIPQFVSVLFDYPPAIVLGALPASFEGPASSRFMP